MGKNKYKIKLISPVNGRYRPGLADNRHAAAPFPLLTVAALTPNEYDLSIECENVELIDFDEHVDLVGLTGVTATSIRANQISEIYRRKGVKTVVGGFYPYYHQDLAEDNFDAVVIGEAELVWRTVLEDAANNRLNKVYKADKLPDMKNMPFPRFDLLKNKSKYVNLRMLETSRGCPHRCEFCSATKFRQFKYRVRPIDEVVEDVKRLKATPDLGFPSIFFIDDNFVGQPNRTKQLLEKLIPLKVKWYSQATLDCTNDKETMELLQRSGAEWLFVGIESLTQHVLNDVNKASNTTLEFKNAIQTMHKYGISVLGAFVFGLEHETKDIFQKTSDFINESELDLMQFNIVYPYPGIATTEKLEMEDRVTSKQWDNYILDGINYVPKSMTTDELQEGFRWLLKAQCSEQMIRKRIDTMIRDGRYSPVVEGENWGLRRQADTVLNNVPCRSVSEHYELPVA